MTEEKNGAKKVAGKSVSSGGTRDEKNAAKKATNVSRAKRLASQGPNAEAHTQAHPRVNGLYKILDKAYFHNDPDESTRRNAFVIHWNNSYATIKALDEKNDFVYTVFKNHLGQTSKGWLRKKDLKPVDNE